MTSRIRLVLVDTNVLFPVRLADLVLSSAADGLFDLCVSDDLLDEIERVLVDRKGLEADKARVFREQVEAVACSGDPSGPIPAPGGEAVRARSGRSSPPRRRR